MLANWEFKLAGLLALYYATTWLAGGSLSFGSTSDVANAVKVVPQTLIDTNYHKLKGMEKGKFAYVQYGTSYGHVNLAILNGIHLLQHGSEADIVIMYDAMLELDDHDLWNKIVVLALQHQIILKPVAAIYGQVDDKRRISAFTQFHAFDQTEYERVIVVDVGLMFTRGHVDELFYLPETIDYALPLAYHRIKLYLADERIVPAKHEYEVAVDGLVNYLINTREALKNQWRHLPHLADVSHKRDHRLTFFGTQLMVIKPSRAAFVELSRYTVNPWYWLLLNRKQLHRKNEYASHILNKWSDDSIVRGTAKVGLLPHQVYGVPTFEYRQESHAKFTVAPQYSPYATDKTAWNWDAKVARDSTRLVYFKDGSIPKPWDSLENEAEYNKERILCALNYTADELNQLFPHGHPRLINDCVAVEVWEWLREEFRLRLNVNWVI